MGVRGLGVQISNQAVPIAYYFRIQERNGLPRPLRGELDGRMEGIYFIKEDHQAFFAMWPDGEYIIYIPPSDCGLVGNALQEFIL